MGSNCIFSIKIRTIFLGFPYRAVFMLVQTGSAFERRLKSNFEILLPIGRKRKDVQCPDIEFNLGEWEPIEAFPSIFSRTALPHRIK
jgi:hypothetical protein